MCIRDRHGAADAGVFVDARCGECAGTGSDGDFASFEVAEEVLPFVVGGYSVFVGGPQGSSTGEEGEMGGDGLLGIDGLVSEGDIDISVSGNALGDVWGLSLIHI